MSQTAPESVDEEILKHGFNSLEQFINFLSNEQNNLKNDYKKITTKKRETISNNYQIEIHNIVEKFQLVCIKSSKKIQDLNYILNNGKTCKNRNIEMSSICGGGGGVNNNVGADKIMDDSTNSSNDKDNNFCEIVSGDDSVLDILKNVTNNDIQNVSKNILLKENENNEGNSTNDNIIDTNRNNNDIIMANDKKQLSNVDDNLKENEINNGGGGENGENDENDKPKTKIRLVAIEKLLDPKNKPRKSLRLEIPAERSVIILDSTSEDDDDNVPLIKVKTIKNINKEKTIEKTIEKSTEKSTTTNNNIELNESTTTTNNIELNENDKQITIKSTQEIVPDVGVDIVDVVEKSINEVVEEPIKKKPRKCIVRVQRNKIIEKLIKHNRISYNCKKFNNVYNKNHKSGDKDLKKDTNKTEKVKKVKFSLTNGNVKDIVEKKKTDENKKKDAKKKNKIRNKSNNENTTQSSDDSDSSSSSVQNKNSGSDSSSSDDSSSSEDRINVDPSSTKTINQQQEDSDSSSSSDDTESEKAENNLKHSINGGNSKQDEEPTAKYKSSDSSSDDEEIVIKKNPSSLSSKSEEDEENNSNGKENESSSDSDVLLKRRKKRLKRSSDKSEKSSDDEQNDKNNKNSSKRKRIRKADSNSSNSDSDSDSPNKKRKNIRKLIKTKDLVTDTKKAAKEEEERRKRIEDRQKKYNKIYEKPESVELNELVLDFDEKTNKKLLKVDSGLLKKLKPHQANGVKFMWDACFETVEFSKTKSGSGCILAHCMGLGKTLQVITLSHTLLVNSEKTGVSRVLVITPLSTLTNWAREFHDWMRFCKNKNVEIYDMSKYRDKFQRASKIKEWFEEGGVCVMGYDMFRILSNPKTNALSKKLREAVQSCLVDPGPDLVICDEGHLLKNEKTSLSKAVSNLKTQRRIVLTGTPLQNNLKEYYCMIQFVKPMLLGTYKEYMNRFVNPIMNGQYTDSTARDIQLMKNRSHVLHKLLEGCIQRRDYSVLAPYLPPKHEYVVFISLSDLQKELYEYYMTKQRAIISEEAANSKGKGAVLFSDFQNLRRIWTHPMSLKVNSNHAIKKRQEKDDTEESEGSLRDFIVDGTSESSSSSDSDSSSGSDKKTKKTGPCIRRTRQNADKLLVEKVEIEPERGGDPSEWWMALCPDKECNVLKHSPKLMLLMQILEECETIGDKVLLFSQSLQSLDVIEHFLSLIHQKSNGTEIEGDVADFTGSWSPGVDYFRLDGSSSVESREYMCKSFNNVRNLRGRFFLISTRAGGLGINLVAANRVIIFDVSWNPSHDTQSIFRVYRFGQHKPCYIYRFIAMGTMEEKVYERQVAKQATAKRVIDEQQISRHYNQNDLLELYKYELEPTNPREIPILPKDRLFADILSKYEKLIFKYHEHDSLLENEESENLSEEERKAAWTEYETEKERPPQQYIVYNRPNYATNGPVTTNKIFGFRTDILLRLLNMKVNKDFPALSEAQIGQLVPVYLQKLYAQMNANDPTLYRELLELNANLEVPQGYYINPMNFANPNMQMNPYAFAAGQQQAQLQPMGGQAATTSTQIFEID